MQTKIVLLIILAAIVALALVLFQYYYKSKKRGRLTVFLSFLRFIGIFGLLLLLINPKFTKKEYTLEKTNLVILTDNSTSVESSKNEIASILEKINSNEAVANRFRIKQYNFGTSLEESNALDYKAKHTNITKALSSIKDIYAYTNTAMLLLTDGNQTIGEDYEFYSKTLKYPIFPIALGDTTKYEDVRIGQVNVNKYAFLKNKYPIETYAIYEGKGSITAAVNISVNGKNVYRENINLSAENNSKRITTLLGAKSVGVKRIKAAITPLDNERNINNNQKNIVIEVIDEKTNIAIISNITHPDIGALKKSIEQNEQRSVTIMKPNVKSKDLEDVDVFILYQPERSFITIYKYIQQKKASLFTVTGAKTNWNFINRNRKQYKVEDGYPIQEVFGVLNPSFSKFDISDFSMEDFPPLESNAGTININEGETLIQTKIQGRTLQSPILLALDDVDGKEVVLFGENIWKWRVQSYRNNQNFENFNNLIGKLMLYLSTSKAKNRLNVDYKSVYQGSTDAKIIATYFDEAFVFDPNASITLKLNGKENGFSNETPMLVKGNFYESDLTNIPSGEYIFSVTVKNENRSKTGSFTILDFDVEKQFLSTDYKKLNQLAIGTGGQIYFPSEIDVFLEDIFNNKEFVPIQKGKENVVPLIDFWILFGIITAALALEWFIRKYNGLT